MDEEERKRKELKWSFFVLLPGIGFDRRENLFGEAEQENYIKEEKWNLEMQREKGKKKKRTGTKSLESELNDLTSDCVGINITKWLLERRFRTLHWAH